MTVLFPEGIQWLFKSVVRFCRVTRGISHDMFWVYLNPAKFYHFFLYWHLSLLPLSCCSLLCLHKCTLTGSRSDQFSSSVTRTSLDFPAFISKDMKILQKVNGHQKNFCDETFSSWWWQTLDQATQKDLVRFRDLNFWRCLELT